MCGVAGAFGIRNASTIVLQMSLAQQPRGTVGVGIVGKKFKNDSLLSLHKGVGKVIEIFPTMHYKRSWADNTIIGHTRYATSGKVNKVNTQPFLINGCIAHCSNGDVPTYNQWRQEMESMGCEFNSGCDGELIAHMLHNKWQQTRDPMRAMEHVLKNVEGAYSSLARFGELGAAFRDPWGIRPMVIGQYQNGWVVASETVALQKIGVELYEIVNPGEAILFRGEQIIGRECFVSGQQRALCFFERVYFAAVPTVMFGQENFEFRQQCGETLAHEELEHFSDDYVVVPVPDSGTVAAEGYAWGADRRFYHGFIRNHYSDRTFIAPVDRHVKVLEKFSFSQHRLRNKRIILVDDSIVRGTTMGVLIDILRNKFGVKEVHVRIACPPIGYSCYLGIDTPNQNDLLAYKCSGSVERMRATIGADSLQFISYAGMRECLRNPQDHCMACVDGKYPFPIPTGIKPSSRGG